MTKIGRNSFSQTASGRYWQKKFAEKKEQEQQAMQKKRTPQGFVPYKTILANCI